jgi:hypothetical protein
VARHGSQQNGRIGNRARKRPGLDCKEEAKATMPQREHRPYVGLMPTMPANAAGCRIDPPVSVPVAPRHRLAATAAAEPPDEPPGTSFAFEPARRHGDTTGPKNDVSFDEPMANSSLLSLPSTTAPSRHRLAVTVDS